MRNSSVRLPRDTLGCTDRLGQDLLGLGLALGLESRVGWLDAYQGPLGVLATFPKPSNSLLSLDRAAASLLSFKFKI